MRKVKLLLVMLMFTLGVGASNVNPKASNALLERVSELLYQPSFPIEKDYMVEIKLQVIEGKIFILSVDTNELGIKTFIKNRLNYATMDSKGMVKGRTYIIPIRIISK